MPKMCLVLDRHEGGLPKEVTSAIDDIAVRLEANNGMYIPVSWLVDEPTIEDQLVIDFLQTYADYNYNTTLILYWW
jgi:hypothetical protein